jgi:hypothetical protein
MHLIGVVARYFGAFYQNTKIHGNQKQNVREFMLLNTVYIAEYGLCW